MFPVLTPQQLDFYRENGYVLTGRVLEDATLELLRAEEARFRSAKSDPPGQLTIFRSQTHDFSQAVREFATRGPQIEWMKQLIGPNIALWFDQFVSKHPDTDLQKGEFPWHQDNGYVSIEPATNVTLWIALDDVDLENGCVWVVPKSHEMGLLDHTPKSADSWFLNVPVEGNGVPAILKAGEAVAFTGLTLHRSKLNKTDRIRRGFFLEYADASAVFGKEKTSIIRAPETVMVAGEAPISSFS
jgi:phytanoyl-CoA hydroxylase